MLNLFSTRLTSNLSKVFATLTLALPIGAFAQVQAKLPVQPITIGMYVIQAEIAQTEKQRELGMMNRKTMGQNEGMLFIFDRAAPICMWMKNTLLPLSVAFLDENLEIINIEEMQPETLTNHCAKKPALYALEMNAEWFKNKHIKAGAKISPLK